MAKKPKTKKDENLNSKQLKFCMEYIIDLNATQAAIRAGYSENEASSAVIAFRLLRNVNIQAKIKELQGDAAEKLGMDFQWVLKRWMDISNRCMTAEPVMELVDGEWVESGEYKFDSSGANKSTEMIAKHLGMFEKDNNQKVTLFAPQIIMPNDSETNKT